MLDNLIFSLNAVMPLFLLIALGFYLRRSAFVGEEFFQYGTRVVFFITLPMSLFRNVSSTDIEQLLDFRFIAFAVTATLLAFFTIWAIARFFVKDKRILGAFVQGSYRSNIVFLGIPLLMSLGGDEGLARAALIITVVFPFYNICSVLVLAACSESETKTGIKQFALTIVKNPLIIGIALGIVAVVTGIQLPSVFLSTIDNMVAMTSPLALICLGGGIVFHGFDKKFKYAFVASMIKVLVLPILYVISGYALGFRGVDLAAIMVLGGTPAAIAGYVTVVQMGGDGYTAGTIVVISTAMSAVTLTGFVYVLRVTGMV